MPRRKNFHRFVDTSSDVLFTDEMPWSVQEAYKALRTNVMFSLPGSGCKIIGLTSAVMHEGKSVNAINLAMSLAQIDKKVVLVECDLRLPTIRARLGLENEKGLTDMLTGQCQAGGAMVHSVEYGIDVITAGTLPPDPTWLLQSKQIDAMMTELKKYYDYIIVDLPPVTTVADASIMARLIDGYVLVVRHLATDKRAISDMLEILSGVNAKILGFLYNDASSGNGKYYKGYYGGYYGGYYKQ